MFRGKLLSPWALPPPPLLLLTTLLLLLLLLLLRLLLLLLLCVKGYTSSRDSLILLYVLFCSTWCWVYEFPPGNVAAVDLATILLPLSDVTQLAAGACAWSFFRCYLWVVS